MNGAGPGSLSVARRADGVATVTFDVQGEALNVLQARFAEELTAVLDALSQDRELLAVVFRSGKADSFIAGADIQLLRAVERAESAMELSREGQRALGMLAGFRVPVVAAIHGACLGGGLELSLACTARVASSHEKTRLGLPEVRLGVLPGLGGTQRLPRLIGVQNALDLLLTGKQIDAQRALGMGLVDEVVPPSILLETAVRVALARSARPPRTPSLRRFFHVAALTEFALAENPIGRKLLFDRANKALFAKTHGNYPAPEQILEVVQLGLSEGFERGLEAESLAFGKLVMSEEARALMHVYFASTELKNRGAAAHGAPARTVERLGVLGAGLMGAGIAQVTADQAKIDVRLKDKDDALLGKGLRQVREVLDERVKSRRQSSTDRDLTMARITATTDYHGFDTLDVVIEAVFEDLELKRRVLSEVEASAKKTAIFASNTSAIPINQIAAAARRPEHVVGMHYFSPVHEMPLLEVVVTAVTAPWVTATCVELGKRQGKTVIVVRDGPGFYTSRILGSYLNEASFLLAEGAAIECIDEALVEWGFPVGPLTLLDEVGIDVAARVGELLEQALGARMAAPPGIDGLLKDERLGKKNQRGFYVYEAGKKSDKSADRGVYALLGVEPGRGVPKHEIALRCALQMINEAAHCFGDGVVSSARDGDIGAIFGLGFPPFRGGPFHYVDRLGAAEVVRRLESYRETHGLRFAPAPVLREMAQTGRSFYGAASRP